MLLIILIFVIVDINYKLSYEYFGHYFSLSESIWSILFSWFLIIAAYSYLFFRRRAAAGRMNATGLVLASGREVPFELIEMITIKCNGKNMVRLKLVDHESVNVYLTDKEIAKLVNFGFLSWNVTDEEVKLVRDSGDKKVNVAYSSRGCYTPPYLNTNLTFVAFLFITLEEYSIPLYKQVHRPVTYFLLAIIGAGILLRYIKKIAVSLDDSCVKTRDMKGGENILDFTDVAKVEKGLFRTKITAKDGRVLYCPRACYLLPELIEVLAGLKKE